MPINYAKVVAECLPVVEEAAEKLGLVAGEDIRELPIVYDPQTRVRRICGYYEWVSGNGLGRIVIYTRMQRDEEYFRAVLLHEFAHALTHWKWPDDEENSHGKKWSYVMLLLGQQPSQYVLGDLVDEVEPESLYE